MKVEKENAVVLEIDKYLYMCNLIDDCLAILTELQFDAEKLLPMNIFEKICQAFCVLDDLRWEISYHYCPEECED